MGRSKACGGLKYREDLRKTHGFQPLGSAGTGPSKRLYSAGIPHGSINIRRPPPHPTASQKLRQTTSVPGRIAATSATDTLCVSILGKASALQTHNFDFRAVRPSDRDLKKSNRFRSLETALYNCVQFDI